LLKCYSS